MCKKIGVSLHRLLVTPATVLLGSGMLVAGSTAFAQAAAVGPSNLGGGYAQIINISLVVASARA